MIFTTWINGRIMKGKTPVHLKACINFGVKKQSNVRLPIVTFSYQKTLSLSIKSKWPLKWHYQDIATAKLNTRTYTYVPHLYVQYASARTPYEPRTGSVVCRNSKWCQRLWVSLFESCATCLWCIVNAHVSDPCKWLKRQLIVVNAAKYWSV